MSPRTITGLPRVTVAGVGNVTALAARTAMRGMGPATDGQPVVLDRAAIQGIVLRGYRMPFGCYLYLKVTGAAQGRDWVARVTDHVTTAAPWDTKPANALNIAFTAAGLRALGVPEAAVASFSTPFVQGMAARADELGDREASAPRHWQDGLGGPDVHILVMLSAGTAKALARHEGWLIGTLGRSLTVTGRQEIAALPSGTEHFGYADGFSQPDIEGAEAGPRTGLGAPAGDGTWRPIRAGEFVLGYPDEEGVLPVAPVPDDLARNGSYLAVRKLRQDVVGFRNLLKLAAVALPGGDDLLAAKLVGRWRDGTPLETSPDRPDPALAADPDRNNTFDYADDGPGYRCPVGAHIRRANPRLSLPFDGKLVNRHRLIRRGLPYGPLLPEGAADDGIERGILFASFQADLERQFEFVQSQWINDGNAFGLGADKDPLLGDNDGTGKFTINGAPPAFMSSLPRLVTTAGGEYFFAPGINGLRYLSHLGDLAARPAGQAGPTGPAGTARSAGRRPRPDPTSDGGAP
jgi:Dyp-type peroxidase family